VRPSLAILAASLLCVGVACRQKELPPPSDRPRLTAKVRMLDVTFPSASLHRDMRYRVILPSSIPLHQKLPVAYLLHGGGGGYRDWSNYSDVSRFAEQSLVLVMPEGNSSYYVNAAERPQDRYEDYITQDLIRDVESRFPAASGRKNRAIVGVSMGGFGAIVLALKHPDLFAFAGGMSSALDVPTRRFSLRRVAQYRAHAQIFGPWGSEPRTTSNPYHLAKSVDPAKTPYLYLTCGEQEGLLPANQRFATLLRNHGFKYEFHPGPGGHDWNQWNGRLSGLVESLRQHLAPN
jgi:putative tributyrin esterase